MNTSLLLVLALSSALVNVTLAVALHIVTPHHHPKSRQMRGVAVPRMPASRRRGASSSSAHLSCTPSEVRND